jgi:predicted small metal-binding protein
MARELRCRDLGIHCEAVIRGETEEEVLEKAVMHALTSHGIDVVEAQMLEQLKAAIQTV